MSTAVHPRAGADQTDVPFIVRASVKLGILESIFVLLIGLGTIYLDGMAETAVVGALLLVGVMAVTLLPGIWTRAETIEGIAGAAGIGLAAAWIFLLVDIALLQPFGLYTNRWLAIGGGSNWWYHPVWWMVGTFLPWCGAWQLANQAAKGATNPAAVGITSLAFTAVVGGAAVILDFPGAGWNVATFGVAFLPGLALATVVSVLGARGK
ncbi:MAG TPA: hypothetical protein VG692_12575 [Gemmatimonadales bacterium]|nr:hypothetical protein [Gemmatimonadales bacterium]